MVSAPTLDIGHDNERFDCSSLLLLAPARRFCFFCFSGRSPMRSILRLHQHRTRRPRSQHYSFTGTANIVRMMHDDWDSVTWDRFAVRGAVLRRSAPYSGIRAARAATVGAARSGRAGAGLPRNGEHRNGHLRADALPHGRAVRRYADRLDRASLSASTRYRAGGDIGQQCRLRVHDWQRGIPLLCPALGVGYTVEAAFFACMLLAMVMQGWRGNRVLGWLGCEPMGLYLTHTLMIAWTGNASMGVDLSARGECARLAMDRGAADQVWQKAPGVFREASRQLS